MKQEEPFAKWEIWVVLPQTLCKNTLLCDKICVGETVYSLRVKSNDQRLLREGIHFRRRFHISGTTGNEIKFQLNSFSAQVVIENIEVWIDTLGSGEPIGIKKTYRNNTWKQIILQSWRCLSKNRPPFL